MMALYRLPIVIFVLLTLLLFHLGLKSGSKSAADEKIQPTEAGSTPKRSGLPVYSHSRWRSPTARPSALMDKDGRTSGLTLKTEGVFVLRRTAGSTAAVGPLLYELLLFDLEGEGVSLPATSVGVAPEPAQSIRF